ncbi:hypothetical protein ACLI4Y_13185 [Natrialbaceae archaeon A-CW3]
MKRKMINDSQIVIEEITLPRDSEGLTEQLGWASIIPQDAESMLDKRKCVISICNPAGSLKITEHWPHHKRQEKVLFEINTDLDIILENDPIAALESNTPDCIRFRNRFRVLIHDPETRATENLDNYRVVIDPDRIEEFHRHAYGE